MSAPTFSIIIPTLNEEKFLPNLLDSLTRQTFKDFEVIVSDGNSKDRTVATAQEYTKRLPTLTVVKNKTPHLSKQRNSGAEIAKGRWLVFADADGSLTPQALEQMHQYIDASAVDHGTSWFLTDSAQWTDRFLVLMINTALEMARFLRRPVATGQCAVVRRKAFTAIGGYDERLSWGEDNDLTRRIVENGFAFGILRKPLVTYSLRRFHKEGIFHTLWYSVKAGFSFLLTKKTPGNMKGYAMGGDGYAR